MAYVPRKISHEQCILPRATRHDFLWFYSVWMKLLRSRSLSEFVSYNEILMYNVINTQAVFSFLFFNVIPDFSFSFRLFNFIAVQVWKTNKQKEKHSDCTSETVRADSVFPFIPTAWFPSTIRLDGKLNVEPFICGSAAQWDTIHHISVRHHIWVMFKSLNAMLLLE